MDSDIPTAHNEAKKGDIAKVVIMPGDPLRAKWISDNYLENAKLVSNVRGICAYTGTYNGKTVTVMAHGMGIPSIGIYSYELFKFYDVDAIIRVGSAGSMVKEINVGDLFIGDSASSPSNFAEEIGVEVKDHILYPTKELYELAVATAKENNMNYFTGVIASHDAFYNKYSFEECSKMNHNAKVVEMEAFGLFANAILLKKKALCLLTCSDSFITNAKMTPIERQTSMKNMVELALKTAAKIA